MVLAAFQSGRCARRAMARTRKDHAQMESPLVSGHLACGRWDTTFAEDSQRARAADRRDRWALWLSCAPHVCRLFQSVDEPTPCGPWGRICSIDRGHLDVSIRFCLFERQRHQLAVLEIILNHMIGHAAPSKCCPQERMLRPEIRQTPGL